MRTKSTVKNWICGLTILFGIVVLFGWMGGKYGKPETVPPTALEIVEQQSSSCIELQKRIRNMNDAGAGADYLKEITKH